MTLFTFVFIDLAIRKNGRDLFEDLRMDWGERFGVVNADLVEYADLLSVATHH